jgi:anti-sigma factor RsiW
MENSPLESSVLRGKTLDCGKVENLMSRYIDRELATAERKLLESHISSCESCAALHADCALIVDAAKELAHRPVPAGIRHRLRKRLTEEIGEKFSDTKPRLYLVK